MQENTMTSVHAKHEALLDELLKDSTDPRDILGEHGLLKQLTKRVVERVLEAELTAHLCYAPHVRHETEEHNARNGKGQKTVQTDTGPLDLVVPRDLTGSFAPQLVPKRQRRLDGFDAKVLSLYARGGRVSNEEMVTPRALIGKVLFPSISTFETPPTIVCVGSARNAARVAMDLRIPR